MGETIRIGTRGSKLALWQANYVADLLRQAHPRVQIDMVVVKTTGDKILDVPLAKIGDKGLFTKELEVQLLNDSVDVCVHSCKDMPTQQPDGLVLACMPPRADARDCIVASSTGVTLDSIAPGARVATGSLRRQAQLARLRPDVEICEIRGNVDTRISKVVAGDFDCAILAAAGITRLGLDQHISSYLSEQTFIPAVGQGAIVVQAREGDAAVLGALDAIADVRTMQAVEAERIVLGRLEGGCQVPLGAYGSFIETDNPEFVLDAFVASLDGQQMMRAHVQGAAADYIQLANDALDSLLDQGAERILEALR